MKPKVLMLGWEFPPLINGGLGVASLGLAEAISQYVDLQLIVPRADPQQIWNNMSVLGLNQLDLEQLWETSVHSRYEQLRHVEMAYVDVQLAGYERVAETTYPDSPSLGSLRVERFISEETSPVFWQPHEFQVKELYGPGLLERVRHYTEICVHLSLQLEFDLIHAHDWMTFLAGMEIKAHTNRPLVLHVHSLEYDRSGAEIQDWVFQLEKHAMQQADKVIAVSAYTRDIIQEVYGINREKVIAIHNAIAPKERKRTSPFFPETLLVFLGRVTEQKGPDYFLEAAAQVLQKRKDVRFIVAGNGNQLPALIEKSARMGVGDRFHFTGHLSPKQAHQLLSMADIFVMPSVSEPFGLVAIEAAQMGVPLIISKYSGAAEVLAHAIQLDPSDIEALATHMMTLIEDPDLRKMMVQQADQDLKALSWDGVAKKVSEVYRRL